MATLTTEMPPLNTAETLAGVTTSISSQNTGGGGGPPGSGAVNSSGMDSTQSSETTETVNNTTATSTSTNSSQANNSNNTISAAADSSDNQPSTPQPHSNEIGQNSTAASAAHHPYANHHIYANSLPSTTTTASDAHLNQIYAQHIYSQSNMNLQQQQQQQQQHQQLQQQPLTPTQHSSYPSYLNSYEQFYQQQQQQQQIQIPAQSSDPTQNPQQMDFINSNSNPLYSASEYKHQAGLRYHPYLHAPTSAIPLINSQHSNANNGLDTNAQAAPVVSAATSSLMSPRVVSSTSPSSSSNQMQISGSASSIGSMSAGNPSSPNSAGSSQCKKCGIMCTNESELQEHITNVHGASPYGSSGYASSPYIKEEMQQQTPPSQNLQTQQSSTQQATAQGGNPGEILDLDSQKMLYPPAQGSIATMMHQPLGNTDPLHGLHSMQQRAGINSWDQQTPEGLPPYLQQQQHTTESKNLPNHSPYYQSPKQSPYHVSNSSNVIKTEYQPIIKSEYAGDTQQYVNDKSFDPTASNQQQQMMPPAVSSSPSEFPSTTTGGPQDNGQPTAVGSQQFRAGNFEPPSSSSTSVSTGPVGAKAANWKSNEARRPKTYNCTACNKWFTSSGHLKRHYNTTLHKNAVKSSGQPDPATLPISIHHHPTRDPTGKTGRRGAAAAAAAAAANAANGNIQQQQQQPNPVQPPEPPNSPQDYGGAQVAASGMTSLSHYAGTASPNSMYQQQQYHQQQQYMPQVQSTTNASPQHASSMTNHHLQQQQQQHQQQNQQQQTVMNGHPNALAGPSVQRTRQQMPMPPSKMRGLLNLTMPSPTVTAIHIIKSERLGAATIEEPDEEVEMEELRRLRKAEVKKEYLEEMGSSMYSPRDDMESVQPEELEEDVENLGQQVSELVLQQQDLPEAAGLLREVVHNAEHHHNISQLPSVSHIHHFRQGQQYPSDMEHPYHNTTHSSTHNNTQVHSPLIISHPQYQEPILQDHQIAAPDTYTLTQITPPPPQQLQPNIMEHQPYISMPSGINMQQLPNNMLRLQQPLTTTGQQQLPPATTIHTTNMVNMLPPNHHHMQQLQQQHTELQQLVNTQLQLDTINTNIPSHITTTNNITNMPSYQQLQQPGSALQPLDPTLTYPHTIIGNAKILTLDAYGNVLSASGHHQQFIQTPDGQLVQLISTSSAASSSLYNNPYITKKSPPEGNTLLMPLYQQQPSTSFDSPSENNSQSMTTDYQQQELSSTTENPSYSFHSSAQDTSSSSEIEYKPSINENYFDDNLNEDVQQKPRASKRIKRKKKSAPSTTIVDKRGGHTGCTSNSVIPQIKVLPNGRIVCLSCDKDFAKICYLTQHNKSFHSGEYPFRCDKCGKRYQLECVFNTHLERHLSTDKAHKCVLCPKQFHHKTDLRRHITGTHNNEKDHVCKICGKGFCRNDHLRKHIETHNRPRTSVRRTPKPTANNRRKTNARVNREPGDFVCDVNIVVEKPIRSSSRILPPLLVGNVLNPYRPVASAVPSSSSNSSSPSNSSSRFSSSPSSSITFSTPSPPVQQMADLMCNSEHMEESEDYHNASQTKNVISLSLF